MGISSYTRMFPLTIASGTSVSNSCFIDNQFGDAYLLTIFAPDMGADSGLSLTIEVAPEREPTETPVWRTLVDAAGTDINGPASLKARVYAELQSVGQFRLKASGNTTANRVFAVSKSDIST